MPLSGDDIIKRLQREGFERLRQKGSHVTLRHPDGRTTTVPAGRKDLPKGMIRAIARQSGITLR